MKKKHNIYISFSEEFSHAAQSIKRKLTKSGFTTFLCDEFKGSELTAEFIDTLYAFVFLISEDAGNMAEMEIELKNAVLSGKKIIPVLMGDFELSEKLKLYLSNEQRGSVSGFSDEDAAELVCESLVNMINSQKPISLIKELTFLLVSKLMRFANRLKSKFVFRFKKIFVNARLYSIVWKVLVFALFLYIYIPLEFFSEANAREVFLVTVTSLVSGLGFGGVTDFLIKKLQNKALTFVFGIVFAVMLCLLMLLTGFFVVLHLQHH